MRRRAKICPDVMSVTNWADYGTAHKRRPDGKQNWAMIRPTRRKGAKLAANGHRILAQGGLMY